MSDIYFRPPERGKPGQPLAKSANPANRSEESSEISNFSKISTAPLPIPDTTSSADLITRIEDLRSLDDWLSLVRQSTSPDEVLDIAECFKSLEWTDVERAGMSRAYVGRLEALFDANPGGWLVDGEPATPAESVQIAKQERGWYGRH